MKHREFGQFKNKPVEELRKNLMEYRDKLWALKGDLAAGKVKNVRAIRETRGDIARILTLMRGREASNPQEKK